MHFTDIRINHFRCLSGVRLQPTPGLNLVAGDNGSGKTSFLEALLFLSRGRTMRAARVSDLIEHGQSGFTVFARFKSGEAGSVRRAGVTRERSCGAANRLDGRAKIPIYELASALPVQVIEPGLHKLIEEGASRRRQFVDWGVFHVERGFYGAWREYRRALAQRNQALRNALPAGELDMWTSRVAQAGEAVDAQRKQYLNRLMPSLCQWSQRLLTSPNCNISLRYLQGWREGTTLENALRARLAHDSAVGYTSVGPHRADVSISIGGSQARHTASRGQQKMVFIALVLTQLSVFSEATGETAVLLVDDLGAELGAGYLASVYEALRSLRSQTFVTLVDERILAGEAGNGVPVFHVEHGRISPP